MKDLFRFAVIASSLLFASSAFAQHQTFTVDPNASQVAWALGGSGHHVNGTFHVQSCSIDFDRTAHTISGSVVVAAGSGNSGEPSRDKKMNDVLDVEHYSEITFVPQKYDGTIAPTGESTIQVSGTFTLHGTPHDLTVPMQIQIDGGGALNAKTHFIVPYVQWGLKDPSWGFLKVAKEADIDLTLTGNVTPAS
jgi:polyisoprenoid-binding protein YceI